ncbi:glycosyltransferase family 10 (fucosyltransferase) c-term domain-containing protein [Ditylenchus destructor]|uniref:Fucosyltransferase n=1 Tax=Ditylenchus destructor TaxID=166010 RepID=A0AAD4NB98_9BILA|nr:glycosyltransferase family 10 (fucosyltransferase) c-term domain-containing protein [Ditylenchus destructor]
MTNSAHNHRYTPIPNHHYPQTTSTIATFLKRILLSSLLIVFIVIYMHATLFLVNWSKTAANISHRGVNKIVNQNGSVPIILAWTGFGFTNKMAIAPFVQQMCPYNCVYTDNRSDENVRHAAIIIYHIRDKIDFNEKDLPPPNSNRLNVFFQTESPLHVDWYGERLDKNYKKIPHDFFNITMTYSKKSDIFLPYDKFEPIDPKNTSPEEIWTEKEISDKVANKSKLVLLFVSHCHTISHREDYVKELRKHIKISEYGQCSGKSCVNDDRWHHAAGEDGGQACVFQEIEKHMFYLAFENAVCNYYVTEKFWQMKRLIVPIVLSRRSLRGLGVPEGSYIATEDFPSPKALAQHLKWLQKNRDEYMKYFAWTKDYKRSSGSNPLCDLCQLAVEGQKKKLSNIVDWWETDGQCEHGEPFLITAASCEILLHIAASWHIDSTTLGSWAIRYFDFTLICPLLLIVGIAYKKRALFIPYVLYKAILMFVAVSEFFLHVAASFYFVGYIHDAQPTYVPAVNAQQMRLADFSSICPLLLFLGVIYKTKSLFVPYVVYKIIFITVIAINSVILLVTSNDYEEYGKFLRGLGFMLVMAVQIGIIYAAYRFVSRIKKNGNAYAINIVNSINSNNYASHGAMRNKDCPNLFL